MEMRLIEIHRGHVKLDVLGRTVTIGGEGFVRPSTQTAPRPEYVDYVVYPNTLTHWDAPWEHEALPSDVRNAVVAYLKQHFEQRGMLLAIE